MKEDLIICSCHSDEHLLLIRYTDPNEDEKLVYISYFLENGTFFQRLLTGIKFIFGFKSKYGHFGSLILSDKHKDKIKMIYEHLN